MDYFAQFLCIVMLIYSGYLVLIAWFFPKHVIEIYKRTKKKDKKLLPFIPHQFLDLMFFNDNYLFSIWIYRVGITIVFFLGLFLLFSVIY
jgi:hypothetical protein